MKIETKFNIGDKVLIHGNRMTVQDIQTRYNSFRGKFDIEIIGKTTYGGPEHGDYFVIDRDTEDNVVEDPLDN